MRTSGRSTALATLFTALLSAGCWEQMDGGQWFPQMKRQTTIQAFEEVVIESAGYRRAEAFSPPEGTVPVGYGDTPDVAALAFPEQEALQNPNAPTLESLKNGEMLFQRNCSACHGPRGAGDGSIAGPPFGTGPFGLVLPIGGQTSVAKGLTDGHMYTTISLGRGRMPSYQRVDPSSRWDIVNYIRELNGQRGRQ